MTELSLASGKDILSYISSSKNVIYCHQTGGYALRSKDSFAVFNFLGISDCTNIIFEFKKICGNGHIYINSVNYVKKYCIANTNRIVVPYAPEIRVFRNVDCNGDVAINIISSIIGVNASGEIKRDSIPQAPNKKLFTEKINPGLHIKDMKIINNKISQPLAPIQASPRAKMAVTRNQKLHNTQNVIEPSVFTYIPDEKSVEFYRKFSSSFNGFINDLESIPDNEFLKYGEKKYIINEIRNACMSAIDKYKKMVIEQCDFLIINYAGYDETIYTKLIVQQLSKNGKVCWIIPSNIMNLYNDDNFCKFYNGYNIKWTDFSTLIYEKVVAFIHCAVKEIFSNYNLIDITHAIAYYYIVNKNFSFEDSLFDAAGVKKDEKIEHNLTHNGNIDNLVPNSKKILCIEYDKNPNNDIISKCNSLIMQLNKSNIEFVQIGSAADTKIIAAVNKCGLSLYDTFSIIKNSIGIISIGSMSKALGLYCKDVPIFNIDADSILNRTNSYNLNYNDFEDFIIEHYATK